VIIPMSAVPAPPVRVAVLTEQQIVLAGVERLLEPFADRVTVVDARSADVIFYDVLGLHSGGEEELEKAVKRNPGRVLALSRELQPGLTARALSLGATASVSLGSGATELLDAVEGIVAGHLQDGSQADLDNQADRRRQLGRDINLTPREQSVLGLIVGGRSNHEVAAELYLSINTVKTVIRSVYRKIGATSRSQAVAWGVQHGFPSEEAHPAGEQRESVHDRGPTRRP
jgi:DNA-binding NarL/FixJ family response regulator